MGLAEDQAAAVSRDRRARIARQAARVYGQGIFDRFREVVQTGAQDQREARNGIRATPDRGDGVVHDAVDRGVAGWDHAHRRLLKLRRLHRISSTTTRTAPQRPAP